MNGKPRRDAWLHPGDVIRIGASLLVVEETDALSGWNERAIQLARSNLALLLEGETGVGKGILARRIHHASGRSGPFVVLNCAALGDSVGEAELFGHVRGAFTGAANDRAGIVASARGGTLLLDEVSSLPCALQPKVLRVLESGSIRPVGSDREAAVDVRFLAATNADLPSEIESGRFRADLHARFARPALRVPALRHRKSDLPGLVREIAGELGLAAEACSSAEVLEVMLLLPWSGNVRELHHLLQSYQAGSPDRPLDVSFLMQHAEGAVEALGLHQSPAAARGASKYIARVEGGRSNRSAKREFPKRVRSVTAANLTRETLPDSRRYALQVSASQLVRVSRSTEGNVVKIAQTLGISRRHVYRLLERYGLRPNDFR